MRTYFKDTKNRKKAFSKIILIFLFCLTLFNMYVKSSFSQANFPEQEIDRWIQMKMEKNNIPGLAVAITQNDQIIFTKGYGKTADQNPITADTPFAIASLSKSFTALAIMQLVEAGQLSLDTPIVQYIPSFTLNDPRGSVISVRHLLNHTSGLTDTVYPDMAIKPQPYTLEDVVHRLTAIHLHNDPGKEFHYNNTNYQLLAWIVETVSKEKFPDYLQQHIFNPLEMHSTLDVSNTNQLGAKPSNLSQGHYLLFGTAVAAAEPEWFVEGAAGMVSTVNDMAKWLLLQVNNGKYHHAQLLSKEGIDSMHSAADSSNSYGMGWEISKTEDGEKQLQHGGILWTYKAEELLLPDKGLGVVILFNSGLNAFVDYYSFASGISGIMTNHPPEDSFLTNKVLETCMGLIIIITVIMGVRGIVGLNKWEVKYKQQAQWLTGLYLILKLVPIYLLISLPQMITLIGGGRVLSLEGIFMMMPSITIWLAIASVQSLIIVIIRVIRILRCSVKNKVHF